MRVVQVICIIARNRRQAVAVGVGIVLCKIVAIPNVGISQRQSVCLSVQRRLRPAQAALVVAVGITDVPGGVAYELIFRVVGISRADRAVCPLRERVAVCVVSVALAVRGRNQAVVRVVGISDGFTARDYELCAVASRIIGVGLVIGVRTGAVLVREPAERVIRRRDRVARKARVAAAVPVRVIAISFLLEVRRALRGGDPGNEVRRVVGIALLYAFL